MLGSHVAHGRRDGGIPLVKDVGREEQGQSRHDNPPNSQRAEADNKRIFQSHDVTQAEHGGAGIYLEHQFGMVGQLLSPTHYTGGEVFVPPAEGGHDEIVKTAYDSRNEQRLGL